MATTPVACATFRTNESILATAAVRPGVDARLHPSLERGEVRARDPGAGACGQRMDEAQRTHERRIGHIRHPAVALVDGVDGIGGIPVRERTAAKAHRRGAARLPVGDLAPHVAHARPVAPALRAARERRAGRDHRLAAWPLRDDAPSRRSARARGCHLCRRPHRRGPQPGDVYDRCGARGCAAPHPSAGRRRRRQDRAHEPRRAQATGGVGHRPQVEPRP